MDDKLPGIALAVILVILVVISAFFFNSTAITTKSFLTIDSTPTMKAIFSLNFALFLIFASVSLGVILALGKKYLFKYALLLSMSGTIFGILLSVLLFPKLMFDLGTPLIFFVAAIPLGIKYLNQKEQELKYLASIRSGVSASGRIMLVFCMGVLIYFLILGISQQQELEAKLLPAFLGVTFGNTVTLSDDFQSQFADSLIQQQKNVVEQIQGFDELKKLKAKKDSDALMLGAKLDAMKTQLDKPEVKAGVIKQLNESNIKLGEEIVKQFPFVTILSKLAWVIYPLMVFTLCLFLSNLILKNLSGVIYSIIVLLYPKSKPAQEAQKV